MAAGNTYVPLQTTTLTSNTASFTFSSISSAYTDLVLIMKYAGCTSAGGTVNAGGQLRFNSDTASNYSQTLIYGHGSTNASGRETTQTKYFIDNYGFMASTSGVFGAAIIQIMNYANTNTYKTFLENSGNVDDTQSSSMGTNKGVGLWKNTSAINSITLLVNSTHLYRTGSTFTLYGIAAA